MKPYTLEAVDASGAPALTRIWNEACGEALAISDRLTRFNMEAAAGAECAGRAAIVRGQTVGFVLASAARERGSEDEPAAGWIDALAVTPEAQRQGLGGRLLAWAEAWLRERGCANMRLGGGLRPFTPGLPVRLSSLDFFVRRGYAERSEASHVYDMGRGLRDYRTPGFVSKTEAQIGPLHNEETARLEAFLRREFPGRWLFEFQEHLRQAGSPEDYLALRREGEVHGFCQVTFEDSIRPIERFYLHGLPRPWGQLGPIGVSLKERGQGLGEALLDAGLCYLRDSGIDGCVIDWVSRPDFYEKFGFKRHNEYLVLMKEAE